MTPPSTTRRGGVTAAALLALVAPFALAAPAWASDVATEVVFTTDDDLDGKAEFVDDPATTALENQDNDGVYGVAIRNLDTGQSRILLAADVENEWIYDDPELSPDGSQVVLSSDRGSTAFDEGIVVVNSDGTGFRRVTSPPKSDTEVAFDLAPAWSPDGTKVVFTRITAPKVEDPDPADIRTALFVVDVTTGAAPEPLSLATDGYTADWSPDGSKIVFAALTPGDDSGPLTVINSDGSGGRLVLGPVGLMPAWSPDGRTIAYTTVTERDTDRERARDTAQIATVPAGGGAQEVLAPTRPDPAVPTVAEYPAWLPDGESIVYDMFGYSDADSFPPGDLWAVDREGVRAGRVMTTRADEAQAHVQGPPPADVVAGTASNYVAVTPKRILETRPDGNVGAPAGKVGAGGTVDLQVHGVETVEGPVPDTATAVILNVTVTGTTASTDVRAYPSGTVLPRASNVNAPAGATVPNLVTVPIGANGKVTLRNSGGEAHLIADIAGYYVPALSDAATASPVATGFTALDPGRILDTRPEPNNVGADAAKVGEAGFVDLEVTGDLPTSDGRTVTVPADARAVVLNVTATGGTRDTDVRVYPTPADGDDAVPTVSNLNLTVGKTAANLVTVTVGEGGKVRLRNAKGELDLIADIAGYYSEGSSGRFVPVAPLRFLDTRTGVGGAPIKADAAGFVDLAVAGVRGIPAGATAAVLNVTGTGVTETTNVRAFPSTAGVLPTVSNLNLARGETRANLSVVKVGTTGEVRVRNATGALHLIGDVAGYMIG